MRRAEKFERLETLYRRWNRPAYVEPDPLQWVRPYAAVVDREVVGLVAAGLAYGRVASVNASVERVVRLLGASPADAVREQPAAHWTELLSGFRHRWTTGAEVAALLTASGRLLQRHKQLGEVVTEGGGAAADLEAGLGSLVAALHAAGAGEGNSLLVDPRGPSAAKRTWMFARWMVRRDEVDPGGWDLPAAGLRMPMDVHVYRLCRKLRWVRSRQPGRRACLEATRAFAQGRPDDPVRYDFALSRLGIRADADYAELFGDA